MSEKSAKQVGVVVTIEAIGLLPEKYLTPQWVKKIEDRIKDYLTDKLGEYEIWGEFFGNDENVYALFLDSVKLSKKE